MTAELLSTGFYYGIISQSNFEHRYNVKAYFRVKSSFAFASGSNAVFSSTHALYLQQKDFPAQDIAIHWQRMHE